MSCTASLCILTASSTESNPGCWRNHLRGLQRAVVAALHRNDQENPFCHMCNHKQRLPHPPTLADSKQSFCQKAEGFPTVSHGLELCHVNCELGLWFEKQRNARTQAYHPFPSYEQLFIFRRRDGFYRVCWKLKRLKYELLQLFVPPHPALIVCESLWWLRK